MSYLDQVKTIWTFTRQVAEQYGGTAMQLAAIDDLSESEFGWGSDCRLKEMWSPYMDEQGDLVLMFEKLTITGYEPIVSITIDHMGLMTTKRHDSGEIEVWDPMAGGWTDADKVLHPMWVIAEKFLEPLKVPSIFYTIKTVDDYPITVATIAETGQELRDVLMWDDVEHLWRTNYWDGPLEGFVRHNGELLFYDTFYEDDVSRKRLYTLHELGRLDALKVHFSRAIWKLEIRLNKFIKIWHKRGWTKLPRPSLAFHKNPIFCYLSGDGSKVVTR